jgi:hypothetical protein
MRKLAGFEVLIAVVMKSTIFWDITPCSPLKDLTDYTAIYPRRQCFSRGNLLMWKLLTYRTVPIQHSPVSKCVIKQIHETEHLL